MRAIITVIGKDRTGIIAGVSNDLNEIKVNILDINQTVLQEFFAMVMLVDLSEMAVGFEGLNEKLESRSKILGVKIRVQREDIFNSMFQI